MITGNDVKRVDRPDSYHPDFWLTLGTRVPHDYPEDLTNRSRQRQRELLGAGLVDLIEAGWAVIGPIQIREETGASPFFAMDPLVTGRTLEIRCRVKPGDQMYRYHPDEPFLDEPGWETQHVPA